MTVTDVCMSRVEYLLTWWGEILELARLVIYFCSTSWWFCFLGCIQISIPLSWAVRHGHVFLMWLWQARWTETVLSMFKSHSVCHYFRVRNEDFVRLQSLTVQQFGSLFCILSSCICSLTLITLFTVVEYLSDWRLLDMPINDRQMFWLVSPLLLAVPPSPQWVCMRTSAPRRVYNYIERSAC